ncbi:fasciclin domain-containing protein [Marinimicrobium locisalis]
MVEVAADNGNLTTLEATGLDETLDDPDGTFTVFAPTNGVIHVIDVVITP